MTQEKLARLRGLVDIMRQRSAEPEIFASIEALATSDGGWLAGKLAPLIGENCSKPGIEGAALGILAQFVEDRQHTLEDDGTPEAERVAYAALVSLKVVESFGQMQGDLRAAETAGRH